MSPKDEPSAKRPRSQFAPTQASVPLHFRMPAKQYDALYKQASARFQTVPQFIRQLVGERLRPKE